MKTVCAKGSVTRGIDIYHGDLIKDIDQVKASSIQYVFMKAFEYSLDPSFKSRWASMKTHGIIRGAYDFFHPSKDALTQANSFLGIVGPLDDGDLPCALDWESTDGTPSATDRAKGLVWLEQVEKVTKKTPIIYTGPYFAQALALDSKFSRFPLWAAQYGVKCPVVPAPWTNWTFWQTSESGSVPGISGLCDTDVFNGTLDDLKGFIAKSRI